MPKRTKFYDIHKSLGAKMTEFAGFEMPVQYSGIIREHLAVRSSVGVFDISHMGNIILRGKDARDFLQKITVNDVAKLKPGKVQYSAMCYRDGGIVDDLLVYCSGEYYRLVVNASNRDKDLEWIRSNSSGDVVIEDISSSVASLAVQGPKSLAVLQKLTDINLSIIKYYNFVECRIAGLPMTVSRSGYTGELGFEIFFDSAGNAADKVWKAVFDAGKEFEIIPAGLGARDTLRLEMGYCLYGNDIDRTTNTLEAGLDWITKFDKGDFIGRDALIEIKEKGLKRRLAGFSTEEKLIPRHGNEIMYLGKIAGNVTSGTYSPSLKKGIGMGYVPADLILPGTEILILARGTRFTAKIENLPFIKK